MHFSLIRQAFAALLVAMLISACGGGSSAAPPPGGITVTPGDGRATVSWTADPNVQYWVFYAPVTTKFPAITTTDWINIPGAQAFINAKPPFVVSSLVNGVQYSFTVNARTGDGPGGPGAPAVSTLTRPAGTTWAKGGDTGTSALRALTYGVSSLDTLGYYLAMGDNGSAYKSTTGLTWTAVPAATTTQINANIYTLKRFVGVGNAGTIVYGTDLATWTNGVSNTTENLNAVASNGALAVTVGNNGTIRTTTDGITWTAATAVPTTNHLYGVAYTANASWIAVGSGGTILRSSDGLTWTLQTSGTAANLRATAVQFVTGYTIAVVGDAGTVLLSSDNGITWMAQTTGLSGNLLAANATGSQILVIGSGGLVAASANGTSWTTRITGTTADLFSIVAGMSQFVAVGASGTNINSQ